MIFSHLNLFLFLQVITVFLSVNAELVENNESQLDSDTFNTTIPSIPLVTNSVPTTIEPSVDSTDDKLFNEVLDLNDSSAILETQEGKYTTPSFDTSFNNSTIENLPQNDHHIHHHHPEDYEHEHNHTTSQPASPEPTTEAATIPLIPVIYLEINVTTEFPDEINTTISEPELDNATESVELLKEARNVDYENVTKNILDVVHDDGHSTPVVNTTTEFDKEIMEDSKEITITEISPLTTLKPIEDNNLDVTTLNSHIEPESSTDAKIVKDTLSSGRKEFYSLAKDAKRGVISIEMEIKEPTHEWTDSEEQKFSELVTDCLVEYMSNWTQPLYPSSENAELATARDVHYLDGTPYKSTSSQKPTWAVTFYISNPMELGGFEAFPNSMVIKSLELCTEINNKFNVNVTKIYEGLRYEPVDNVITEKPHEIHSSSAGNFLKNIDPLVIILVGSTGVSIIVILIGVFCWTKCRKQTNTAEDGYNIEQKTISYIKEDMSRI